MFGGEMCPPRQAQRPRRQALGGSVADDYFQCAHLLSALVVNTWSPGSFFTIL